jgi:cytochrome b6-f complex iron-sulfur subunit
MKTNPTTDQMKRGEFLRSLGMSSAALMSFYCLGTTMTACSSDNNDDPTPTPGTGSGKVDFTLDLTTAANAKLKTDGGFVYQDSIIVARVKGGNYVALSKSCTHAGVDVQYRLAEDDFWCSPQLGGHGSEYAKAGAVEKGPAAQGLKVYKATPSADGSKVRVTE